ncbi:hydrogenase maturation protein HypF [Prauserella shujinwangii]|uniref:Carbamoyltransferase n=1 Tax=Prauserella shujinwangii TaxID=1453103 RepID=A0A2T0LN44_9PSEU|nr:hydrogenase maturation protein HypF [Prauserella shujinwangii]
MRREARVEGVVQGVGFRPFVHTLARRLGLAGHVGNDADGVFLAVEGSSEGVARFLDALKAEAPPLAVIDRIEVTEVPPLGAARFDILPSPPGGVANTLVSADSATCADCLRELADPGDRRYRYPFVNCTNCGPRFTIVRGVPYDRPRTTMAGFALCRDCAREYADPADRRFHAQPVCCPACGPRLRLGTAEGDDALRVAVRLLGEGRVLAVKGLGGYHLAVAAASEPAAAALRSRKHREDKPFAIMVPDLAVAGDLCEVDPVAERLLTGRRRPIVLLPRRRAAPVAPSVAPGNRMLGVLLPYTPLHHLLLTDFAAPIVLTSANVSDEPIVFRDDEARDRLSGIADAFLTHDRPIHVRTDDSVARTFRGRAQLQRRSRGYAPEPVVVGQDFRRHVLACGAELKNTFCLAKGRHAFLSHHIGDLENYETLRSFTEGIEHFGRLFDIAPEIVAHDLHPEYLSTKYALDLAESGTVEPVGVQHHHAHIAACLADNAESGPVLGVAFDGTGYGTDHTIWGGEFLLADLAGFRRVGHLEPVRMPGGTAAVRQPWRMAAAYLGATDDTGDLDVVRRHAREWPAVVSMAASGVNAPLTSSAGRLFDAVAALLGVRDTTNYEGQAAIELEQLADPAVRGGYPAGISAADPVTVSGADLVKSVVDDLRAGRAVDVVAARFHNGVAEAIRGVCARLREATGVGTVALSGGVFQNVLLLDRTVDLLEGRGFRVLTHSRVPTNDGGVSLGQAVVAANTTGPVRQ